MDMSGNNGQGKRGDRKFPLNCCTNFVALTSYRARPCGLAYSEVLEHVGKGAAALLDASVRILQVQRTSDPGPGA